MERKVDVDYVKVCTRLMVEESACRKAEEDLAEHSAES